MVGAVTDQSKFKELVCTIGSNAALAENLKNDALLLGISSR